MRETCDEPAVVKWVRAGLNFQVLSHTISPQKSSYIGLVLETDLTGEEKVRTCFFSLCSVVLIEPQVNFLRGQWRFRVPEGTGEVCETRWEVGPLFPELFWVLFRPWSRIELFVVIKYPVAGSWNGGYTKKNPKTTTKMLILAPFKTQGKNLMFTKLRLMGCQNSAH